MGIVSISLGARAPVSLGLLGKVPAFILGINHLPSQPNEQ